MAKTTLAQDCTNVTLSNGERRFQLKGALTYLKPGDLPGTEIFVHEVQADNDPKADRFLRVANVVDLTRLPRGRESALRLGSPVYLSSALLLQYEDIAVAIQAKKLLTVRVDQLISDWLRYRTEFITPSQVTLPQADANALTQARLAYAAARALRLEAEAKLVSARSAAAAAQAALESVLSRLAALRSLLAARRAERAALAAQVDVLRTQGVHVAGLQAVLATMDSALGAQASEEATLGQGQKEAEAALASARVEQSLAQAEADNMQRQEGEALEAAQNLCPSFTP